MARRNLPLVGACIIVLALTGFGCKKKTAANPQTPTQATGSRAASGAPETYPDSPDGITAPEITYLRQVISNFANVQSFRAHMSLPTDVGMTTSDIEYARTKGLHGNLSAPGVPASEIYLLSGNVYFRSGTSSWLNLAFTDEGQQIMNMFASAFSLTGNTTSTYVSDSASQFKVEDDAAHNCKRYTFVQDSPDDSRQTMFVCVKDDLPVLTGTVTKYGNLEITYRDFNRPIDIVSPVK